MMFLHVLVSDNHQNCGKNQYNAGDALESKMLIKEKHA